VLSDSSPTALLTRLRTALADAELALRLHRSTAAGLERTIDRAQRLAVDLFTEQFVSEERLTATHATNGRMERER
jgi:hypothetical protein